MGLIGRTRALLLAAGAVAAIAVPVAVAHAAALAPAGTGLGACPFWTNITPPPRSVTPFKAPPQLAPQYSVASRLPAPAGVSGALSGGQVRITFDRVAGAGSYRLWRNAIAVQWITDTGAATYTATDPQPCDHAFYTLVANPDSTTGPESQLSQPYQLTDAGTVQPWPTPAGQTMQMMVTSYNDPGATASGYTTQLGICAVDPRVIPWGTRFYVPDYGWCYAADIGTWIQNSTLDVWLPGTEANDWGVQTRTITIGAGPTPSPTPTGRPTPTPTGTPTPRGTPTPTGTPTPRPTATPSATPTPVGGATVANPGFETGGLAPWTCGPADAVVSAPVHSGHGALAAAATGFDTAQCSQAIAVRPGRSYALSAWTRGQFAFVGVSGTGGADGQVWASSDAYTQQTLRFTTGPATTSVTIYVHGWYGQGTVNADDFAVT